MNWVFMVVAIKRPQEMLAPQAGRPEPGAGGHQSSHRRDAGGYGAVQPWRRPAPLRQPQPWLENSDFLCPRHNCYMQPALALPVSAALAMLLPPELTADSTADSKWLGCPSNLALRK